MGTPVRCSPTAPASAGGATRTVSSAAPWRSSAPSHARSPSPAPEPARPALRWRLPSMEQTRPEHRPIPVSGAGAHLCLYLVLCGERPLLGGMAFDLGGVHELTLGRGGPLGASVRGPGQARIDVPDP